MLLLLCLQVDGEECVVHGNLVNEKCHRRICKKGIMRDLKPYLLHTCTQSTHCNRVLELNSFSSHTGCYKCCSALSALKHTCAALTKVLGIIWLKMFWQDYFNLREVLDLACKDERNQKMERFQKMVRASYVLNQLNTAYGD